MSDRDAAIQQEAAITAEPGCSVDGPHIDGSVTRFWATRRDAAQAAREIGWPVNSTWGVHTRFQRGWALHQTHGGFLTRDEYGRLWHDRNDRDHPEEGR